MSLLEALLRCLAKKALPPGADGANGDQDGEALLASMAVAEEQRLLEMLAGLGQFEAAYPLLLRLATLRPNSPAAQEAYLEAVLVQGKQLLDRARWEEAKELLAPLSRLAAVQGSGKTPPRPAHIALVNMLGCCAGMLHDFELEPEPATGRGACPR